MMANKNERSSGDILFNQKEGSIPRSLLRCNKSIYGPDTPQLAVVLFIWFFAIIRFAFRGHVTSTCPRKASIRCLKKSEVSI